MVKIRVGVRGPVQERNLRIEGATASSRRSPWTVWAMGTSAGDGLNGFCRHHQLTFVE